MQRLVVHPSPIKGRQLVLVPTALVPHDPRLVTDDMVALRFAALKGVGAAAAATAVRPELLQEGLVEVLPP